MTGASLDIRRLKLDAVVPPSFPAVVHQAGAPHRKPSKKLAVEAGVLAPF